MSGKVIIVGLGYGDEAAISLGTLRRLEQSQRVYLRTEKHPVVSWLRTRGISFVSFDSIYEAQDTFEQVYQQIATLLLQRATAQEESIVYAVPGHPMVAEKTVQLLLAEGKDVGVEIEVCGGGSFLDISFSRLRIDPIEGFLLLDGSDLDVGMLNAKVHLLLGQVYSRLIASDVKLTLMECYPDEHLVQVVRALGVEGEEVILSMPLYELDRGEHFDNLTSVYVPPVK